MPITESEVLSKHVQSLGEAHRACQEIGRNADPEWIEPRGRHYKNLKDALMALEGSCRQLSHFRADARWLKLGILYGRANRAAQAKFVRQDWMWFNKIRLLFDNGLRAMDELANAKTGRLASKPILPSRPSDWLTLPDHVPVVRGASRIIQ